MLTIVIPPINGLWDERTSEFVSFPGETLEMEHSLISISKWESKWHKPYLVETNRPYEEILSYIECMIINKTYNPNCLQYLTEQNIKDINDYINDKHTATTFVDNGRKGRNTGTFVTSEIIYGWMVTFRIPAQFEKWHLNRLLTLIRVCEDNNKPKKKMSPNAVLKQYDALNAKRKAAKKR